MGQEKTFHFTKSHLGFIISLMTPHTRIILFLPNLTEDLPLIDDNIAGWMVGVTVVSHTSFSRHGSANVSSYETLMGWSILRNLTRVIGILDSLQNKIQITKIHLGAERDHLIYID